MYSHPRCAIGLVNTMIELINTVGLHTFSLKPLKESIVINNWRNKLWSSLDWSDWIVSLLIQPFVSQLQVDPLLQQYFDPCYARATVVRARFLAATFSDGSYLAHVNGAYLRHVTFCIVRGPLFIVSPISQRGPASVRGPLPTVTVPGWSKVPDSDVEGVEQTCSRIQPASPI